MAFINQATALNVKSELDIFKTYPIQTAIEGGSVNTYRPITSISNATGPIEFVVSASSNDEYVDLARVYLNLKVRLTVVAPVVAGVAGAMPVVGPVNNWLHSIFSQVDVYLNQKCVTPPMNNYGYRAYIENLLNYSSEAKRTHLTTGCWADDTAGHMDETTAANLGFTTRRALTINNNLVDLYGPLHCDLFNVDTYLLNGVEMTVKLQRAASDFHLMGGVAQGRFEIVEAELYVRKVKINSSVLLAHHKALAVATAKYPITRVDVKTITIPANTQSRVLDNVFLGTLPKRCIIGFVETDTFNGTVDRNPYNFKHFNYTRLAVFVDSVSVPLKPFECDFPNGQYIRAYNSLFEGCNINHADIGNNISRTDYANGYALLAVDLTPDLNSSAAHVSIPKTGSLRIDVRFAAALGASITAIIFAEFDSLIEIDKNRNIITDYSS